MSLNTFCSTSIDAGDCLSNSWIDELVTIALPYCDVTKSSTSCVIVVTHRLYLRALLTSQNTNLALSSYCIIFHASSITSILFLLELLTVFQIYLRTIYIATGLSDSSRSRTENTTSHSCKLILVFSENIHAKIQYTYFSNLSTTHFAQSMVSRTEYKSFITGISLSVTSSSSNVIHLSEYVTMIAFSSIDDSDGVNLPNIRFIRPIKSTIAHLNKSPDFASVSLSASGKSNGLILSDELRLMLR